MDELKKEITELIDKLAKSKDIGDCNVMLEAIDKRVWLVYETRIKELTDLIGSLGSLRQEG